MKGARETPADVDGVNRLCSSCHALPPPSSFAKDDWGRQIEEWYEFATRQGVAADRIVSRDAVLRYYQKRAPERLDVPAIVTAAEQPRGFNTRKHFFSIPGIPVAPGVTNVKWAQLMSESGLDCLVCDMRHGKLLLWEKDRPELGLATIAHVGRPAHVEVVDLDQDGQRDLLVADLGSFFPSDERQGRVVWLRRSSDSGEFRTIALAENLGRVADVQAADFDRDGDLDLVVAVFGWRNVGQVLYLENRTRDYGRPDFHPVQIDRRNGAIHVPVADLNGDGRPDFVVLLSQEHETIVAYLNNGPSKFVPQTIFEAGDPAYGSTGIALVDMDADGDVDVLYTNGDLMDSWLPKPYHSIQWLENEGGFPFRRHPLAPMAGVHRAVAGDVDGDGDIDVVATAFIPDTEIAARGAAVLWLEQREQQTFVAHVLETLDCDHPTADLADFDRDGDLDLVTGYMTWGGISPNPQLSVSPKLGWIAIWENLQEQ